MAETGQSLHIEYLADSQNDEQRTYVQDVYPLKNEDGSVTAVVGITGDVTERRAFEKHLQHREKLAALGQLSLAVAHEIRNPLSGIRLGIDSLLEDNPQGKTRETLELVSEDIHRLDRILGQLLDFGRRREPLRGRIDLAKLIERCLSLMRKPAAYQKVQIQERLHPDLPIVKADPDQIQQVLLNLFMNALQAMPEGGVLSLIADRLVHERKSGVLISVRDTGTGLPPEALDKLFRMEFTTKPSGSGMGLAISNQIISDHGGSLWAQSEKGRGAQINIFLPTDPKTNSR